MPEVGHQSGFGLSQEIRTTLPRSRLPKQNSRPKSSTSFQKPVFSSCTQSLRPLRKSQLLHGHSPRSTTAFPKERLRGWSKTPSVPQNLWGNQSCYQIEVSTERGRKQPKKFCNQQALCLKNCRDAGKLQRTAERELFHLEPRDLPPGERDRMWQSAPVHLLMSSLPHRAGGEGGRTKGRVPCMGLCPHSDGFSGCGEDKVTLMASGERTSRYQFQCIFHSFKFVSLRVMRGLTARGPAPCWRHSVLSWLQWPEPRTQTSGNSVTAGLECHHGEGERHVVAS